VPVEALADNKLRRSSDAKKSETKDKWKKKKPEYEKEKN
jgi:hypothetical protein